MKQLLIALISFSAAQGATAQTARVQLQQQTGQALKAIVDSSMAITGCAVMDLSTETIVFAGNENMILPQASAIKIPILMEVYKQVNDGRFALTDQQLVTKADQVGGSGVLQKQPDSLRLSVYDLCVLMMTQSDNTATNVLLKLAGMDNVNQTLQSLGFTATCVHRKMMDTEASAKGIENNSSPAEAVAILNLLYQGRFINKSVSEDILTIIKQTDKKGSRIAAGVPRRVPVAYKPGVLTGVSTEWAIVYAANRPYAIAIMEKDKPARDSSHTIEKMSAAVYDYFSRMPGK